MSSDNQKTNKSDFDNTKNSMAFNAATTHGTYDTGTYYTNGNMEMNVGQDILDGSTFRKYEHQDRLVGTQLQYRNSGNLKVINFKQDYVVLIRKKLFYAANANMMVKDGATMTDGNYVRSYKLDNWTSIRTNISIAGTPGNCQIDLKGGERVLCWEEMSIDNQGVPKVTETYNGMVSDEWPDNNAQVRDANNDVLNTPNIKDTTTVGKNINNVSNAEQAKTIQAVTTKANVLDCDVEERELNEDYNWSATKSDDGQFRIITIKSKKPDENGKIGEKTIQVPIGQTKSPNGLGGDVTLNNLHNGYKIAEKCDWEPMDEVWVYGKSNFERDSSGDFKMNQIFFGYIDTVSKSYQSGKTNGCTISITATDQLKILDLSYLTMNPSMTPGASGAGGLDLRFSNQDVKHFGTFELFNPFAVTQMIGLNCDANTASEAQKQVLRSAWRYFTLNNIFAGKPVHEIVKELCLDAGVPPWYLKKRIEPIMFPPFTYSFKQSNSQMLFNASMMKRLAECQSAAKKLMLEFFADEEGNIVLKCPNYALGVNSKPANNMGLSDSCSMINNIDIDKIAPYYAVSNGGAYTKELLKDMTPEQRKKAQDLLNSNNAQQVQQYMNVKAQEEMFSLSKGKTYAEKQKNVSGMLNTMDNSLNTNEMRKLNTLQKQFSSFNNSSYGNSGNYVQYTVKSPDTFTSIANEVLGNPDGWADMYNQAKAQYPEIKNQDNCQAIYGKTIMIDKNRLYASNNGIVDGSDALLAKNKFKEKYGDDESTWLAKAQAEDDANTAKAKQMLGGKSALYETKVRQQYSDTLSERTDALIPEIPQEYITSFQLTDTDKNIYNMYEINIEGDFGVFDKGGPLQKISRVFPDIASMIRFGCRPAPGAISFPYMGNRENAHMLGFMMCAKSLAQRNCGSLSMIEDSFIKVGNPIRFFAYDEHPDIPLSEQKGDAGQDNSVLNEMSAKKEPGLSSDKSLEVTEKEHYAGLQQEFDREKENAKIIHQAKQEEKQHDMRNPEELAKATDENGNGMEQGSSVKTVENADGSISQVPIKDIEKTKKEAIGSSMDGQYVVGVETGNAINWTTNGSSGKKTYEFVSASEAAMKTDAQSVYYVEQVSRSMSPTNISTMTLTLSCGRMMGKPSVIDYMLLLYKPFFDPALGFCADITEINQLVEKYNGKTKSHTILSSDSLVNIAYNEYGLKGGYQDEYTAEDLNNKTAEETNGEENKYPYSLENLCNEDECSKLVINGITNFDNIQSIKLIDFINLFKRVKAYTGDAFTNLTSIDYGYVAGFSEDSPNERRVIFSFITFIFDGNKSEWCTVRTGFGGTKNPNYKWLLEADAEDEYKKKYGILCNHTAISAIEVFDTWAQSTWTYNLRDKIHKEGDNSELALVAWNKDIVSDLFQDKITSASDIDYNKIKVKEESEGQKKVDELYKAIIALNVDKFGNSLNINEIQFNGILMAHVDEAIIIPNEIILDSDVDTSKSNDSPKDVDEIVEVTDEEKAKFGDDVVKHHIIKDGQYSTRYEGSKMTSQYYFSEHQFEDATGMIDYRNNKNVREAYEKSHELDSTNNSYEVHEHIKVKSASGDLIGVDVVNTSSTSDGNNLNTKASKLTYINYDYEDGDHALYHADVTDKEGKPIHASVATGIAQQLGYGGHNNIEDFATHATGYTVQSGGYEKVNKDK